MDPVASEKLPVRNVLDGWGRESWRCLCIFLRPPPFVPEPMPPTFVRSGGTPARRIPPSVGEGPQGREFGAFQNQNF